MPTNLRELPRPLCSGSMRMRGRRYLSPPGYQPKTVTLGPQGHGLHPRTGWSYWGQSFALSPRPFVATRRTQPGRTRPAVDRAGAAAARMAGTRHQPVPEQVSAQRTGRAASPRTRSRCTAVARPRQARPWQRCFAQPGRRVSADRGHRQNHAARVGPWRPAPTPTRRAQLSWQGRRDSVRHEVA